MVLCGCRRRSDGEKQRNQQMGCRKSCSSLHNPIPPLVGVGAEDRCSRIGKHSEAIHAKGGERPTGNQGAPPPLGSIRQRPCAGSRTTLAFASSRCGCCSVP